MRFFTRPLQLEPPLFGFSVSALSEQNDDKTQNAAINAENTMPLRYTRGFRSLLHRSDHFRAHRARLGIATEQEYETLADSIFGPGPGSQVRQFKRSWNSDIVRYDELTDVFAILDQNRFLKTCYCPDPMVHGEATNLD